MLRADRLSRMLNGCAVQVLEDHPMSSLASALIKKLTVTNELDGKDIRAIEDLRIHERQTGARRAVVRDGDRPGECCLVVGGFCSSLENDFRRPAPNPVHPYTG